MCATDLRTYELEEAVKLIVSAGKQLKCSVRTRSKALMIYHQFKRCVGEMEYDPNLLAAACINLGAKTNGEDIELDAILQTFFCILDGVRKSILKDEFKVLKESLVTMECLILRMIDFDLNHRLAHEYLVYFLYDIKEELQALDLWYELMEQCLKMITDFYLSKRCLNYKAEDIASSAIQAAFILIGLNIESCSPYFKTWFQHLKENTKKEDIFEDFFRICVITPEAERHCTR